MQSDSNCVSVELNEFVITRGPNRVYHVYHVYHGECVYVGAVVTPGMSSLLICYLFEYIPTEHK